MKLPLTTLDKLSAEQISEYQTKFESLAPEKYKDLISPYHKDKLGYTLPSVSEDFGWFMVDERSWKEDVGINNGDYMCTCSVCNNQFIGHKRRRICALCSEPVMMNYPANVPVKFIDPKQVILVRKDIEMSPGKLAAQVAHASVSCLFNIGKWEQSMWPNPTDVKYSITLDSNDIGQAIRQWMTTTQPKIVLEVKDLDELDKFYKLATDAGLLTSYIVDSGRTEFCSPTATCVGIGPAPREAIDAITKRLRLYK